MGGMLIPFTITDETGKTCLGSHYCTDIDLNINTIVKIVNVERIPDPPATIKIAGLGIDGHACVFKIDVIFETQDDLFAEKLQADMQPGKIYGFSGPYTVTTNGPCLELNDPEYHELEPEVMQDACLCYEHNV